MPYNKMWLIMYEPAKKQYYFCKENKQTQQQQPKLIIATVELK